MAESFDKREANSDSDSDDEARRSAQAPNTTGIHFEPQKGAQNVTVVYTQPTAANPGAVNPTLQWMVRPAPIPGCPDGLEYLTMIDQLIIKQEVELVEVFLGWEQNNKYRVFNSMGQQVYFVVEDTSCIQRQCCGPARGFKMDVFDNNNKLVLRFAREFVCCTGCCWCADNDHCAYQMNILTPDDQRIGHVRQEQYCCKPRISAQTAGEETFGTFHGPCCVCNCPCTGDVEFPLIAKGSQTQIGKVSKQWTGLAKEWFTNADNFSVTFPMDMDVKAKATLFGTAFVVDMMFFQNNN